ncbi:hypothetical protein PIB30_056080 [Stylosanthes scabra]|uniref:BRO1 domain-containing protein n=1 Tax=Stylosanthes scabra TaxID=79078 RepID=A0ABU6RJM1_9FABA|nr:hypothetical protein [Stylosanthes scabra]
MSNDNGKLLNPNPNPNPKRVLSIPVKKSNPVELHRPLRNLVATKYSESDAQKVESVLDILNKCRWSEEKSSPFPCNPIGASYCDLTTVLGRHLAMDAFNDAANFFLKLRNGFAMDISATLDLTFLVAESLHSLFSAQALELKLEQQLHNTNNALQQHRFAVLFELISKHYWRAFDLLLCDSAEEARQRRSSILPKSKRPKTFDVVQLFPLGRLLRGICVRTDQWIPKQQRIFLDLVLSEHSPFRITHGGILVAKPWDTPPLYPTNLAILSSSSSSDMLAIPLKKSEPLDLYDSLCNYFVLTYSESVAKSIEGFVKVLNKLRIEMQRDDLSLPIRRDCLIHYFKCLCMIETFFSMTTSPNPPIFVWYNAFSTQQDSFEHNIHLEKASVLFNLGALCTLIASSCDLTTIQGHHVAMDALSDASHWFLILPLEAEKVSATIDLSLECIQMLREIITVQIADLKRSPHCHSDGLSVAGYPVSLHYQKAYDLLTSGPLAENLVQSWIPQFLESKMKTSHVQTGPSDVTEQFISGIVRLNPCFKRDVKHHAWTFSPSLAL